MYNYEELKATYGHLIDEQLFLESRYKLLGMERTQALYDKARADNSLDTTALGQKFINYRYDNARRAVATFIADALKPKAGVKPTYVNVLTILDEAYKDDRDELVDLLAMSTLSVTLANFTRNRKEMFISNVCQWIGAVIKDEYNLKTYLPKAGSPQSVISGIDKRVQSSYKRAFTLACMRKDNFVPSTWIKEEIAGLCCQLLHIVAGATGYFVITTNGTKGLTIVEPTELFIKAWNTNEADAIANSYRLCPTIVPPLPWTDYNEGGYYGDLQAVSTLLRIRDTRTVFGKQYLRRLGQTELSDVRKAINSIQSTPWRINKKILAVVLALKEQGGNRAGLPCFEAPPKPAVLPDNPTEEEIIKYKERMVTWYRGETRRKSLTLRALSHIKTAQEFKDYDRIYFPCNMDFRGRVYPIPSFSFQGDDLNKALIEFADAPACKDYEDIKWLAVHGANLAGVDKVSYEDRIKWVYDNEYHILKSAANPIGYQWWQDQDEPMQFLAFCYEWQAWKEWEGTYGTAEGFVSSIPVAFDGTCSGLQHFSAILRDTIGGTAVNLVPAEKPSDIYAVVAEKVNEAIDKDLARGTGDEVTEENKIKYGTRTLAQIWRAYGVTRKVTKRSTMTLAYGSKEYGFRDQVMDDIIKPDMDKNGDSSVFNKYNCWQASAYMARLIWTAVGETVVKAVEGMKWLQKCAKLVTKSGQVVTWVTPLGLPVQQSYMKCESSCVRMRLQGKFIRLYSVQPTGDIDKKSQASGIAPNFIHSMDAAHLQLTVCNCYDQGVRHFAMIHDSYGCPVAQAQVMYETVRRSFIQMYTENDVLANFSNDMQVFSDTELPQPPDKGTLDLDQVMNSKYIFS